LSKRSIFAELRIEQMSRKLKVAIDRRIGDSGSASSLTAKIWEKRHRRTVAEKIPSTSSNETVL
jgi:hypothetical protein